MDPSVKFDSMNYMLSDSGGTVTPLVFLMSAAQYFVESYTGLGDLYVR